MPLHLSTLKAVWGTFKTVKAAGSWVLGQATTRIALPIYRRSHALWVSHHRLGAHWRSLGAHLEYSIYIGQLTDPKPRHTVLAVRAREGVKVDRASFVLEASSAWQRYQEPIDLHNLDRTPITWTTTKIPPDELVHASEEGIAFRWEEYRFTNIQLSISGRDAVREPDSIAATLTHTWLLNSEWKRVDEFFLNLDAIKRCRQDISIYWRFVFCRPIVFHGGPRRRGLTRFDVLRFVAQPLKAVMSTELAATVQFWVAAGTFYRFSDEGKLVPRFAFRRWLPS